MCVWKGINLLLKQKLDQKQALATLRETKKYERCDPEFHSQRLSQTDLNRDIPKETGSQGPRNTGLCDRSM